MGRLTFIGLGLDGVEDISVRGLEAAKRSDKVYAEFYTSRLVNHDNQEISRFIGKDVMELDRGDVEQKETVLEAAIDSDVAFLTAGDPMTATTHLDLYIRALKRGIDVQVIHSPSIFIVAPSLLGLQHYKFGKTTTVPFPRDNYSPTSPYMAIEGNLGLGLHTLVLLDIDKENGRYMTGDEGIRELFRMETEMGKGVFTRDTLVCVIARAGSKEIGLFAGPAGTLSIMDFGAPPHSLVVPGELHFMEEEAMRELCIWPG